jgi:hypothetical protein
VAYVDPNAQETPAPSTAAPQAPVAAGGAGVGGATKAASTPGQNVPAQPSAQLSAYLNANQPQSAALASNVAQTVGNQVNAAGQAIQPAIDAFTQNIYSVPTDAATNAAVAQSPSSLTDAQKSSYQAELGAAANAPNSANTFETTKPYQDLTTGIQGAVDQANLWNSGNNVATLSTALSPFEGPNATSGDNTLDAILLSQTPDAYGQIQAAVAPAAALPGQLTSATAGADAALRGAIAQDTAATPAAQTAAQTYATNLTNYLNQAVATNQAAVTAQGTQNGQITTDAAAGNLTAADALALGIPADQAAAYASSFDALNPAINAEEALWNNPTRFIGHSGLSPINLSSYLSPGTTAPPINLADVATPQNYSDVAALQALLGPGNNVPLPISAATSDQAGLGLNVNAPVTYNSTAAKQAFGAADQTAQKFAAQLAHDAQIDPAQTSEQAAIMSKASTNINNIIAYLNQLSGQSATGTTPPTSGAFRAI